MNKIKRRYLIPALLLIAAVVGITVVNLYFSSTDVLVYMYHSVRDDPVNPDDADLSVRVEEFEKQLAFFAEHKRKTIFASELADIADGEKYLLITFDDGYEDNYTEVYPLLKKYNCKATIFMITRLIGKEGYLSAEQIREMTESGLVSVQSHTVSHDPLALGDKEYEDVDYEMRTSKLILEAISGKNVDSVALPNGSYDPVVLDIAGNYYDIIFSGTSLRPNSIDLLDVQRTGIYRHHSTWDVKAMTNYRGLYTLKRVVQKFFGPK